MAYNQSVKNLSPELKLFIEEHIEYIENNQFDALYEMLSSTGILNSELTDVLLAVGIDPIKYFDTYLPSFYASGLPIEEVTITRNIYQINPYAFYVCPFLAKVNIELGVETIGEESFYMCNNLREITLPSSILWLQSKCFGSCAHLKDVYYQGTKEQFSRVKINNINEDSEFNCIQCTDGDFYL